MEFALPAGGGTACRVLEASPSKGIRGPPIVKLVRLSQGIPMDDVAPPFGSFMEAMPHWAFIIIHSVLIVVALLLYMRTRNAGFPNAATGFLLFVVAELSYITYHAHQTHFLFAHLIAEVCDVLALVTIALGLSRRVTPVVPGAPQHR